jgi:uridine kinase
MNTIDEVVNRILDGRASMPESRSLLVGISGIDGSGKGHITTQLEARLSYRSVAAAKVNVDSWLNLPNKRFCETDPAGYFYRNAIRFDELFNSLVLPLRDHRSVDLMADFAEETANSFRKHAYRFKDVSVILLEGIFLFKSEFRSFFDLAIWVDCSFSTALARALERRQERMPPAATIDAYETIYFPAQRIHLDRDDPRASADLIVNNDGYFEKHLWQADHYRTYARAQTGH